MRAEADFRYRQDEDDEGRDLDALRVDLEEPKRKPRDAAEEHDDRGVEIPLVPTRRSDVDKREAEELDSDASSRSSSAAIASSRMLMLVSS